MAAAGEVHVHLDACDDDDRANHAQHPAARRLTVKEKNADADEQRQLRQPEGDEPEEPRPPIGFAASKCDFRPQDHTAGSRPGADSGAMSEREVARPLRRKPPPHDSATIFSGRAARKSSTASVAPGQLVNP